MSEWASMLRLTARDGRLMEFVGVSGIAGLSQLARGFFAGCAIATTRARLSKLEAAGLLASKWGRHQGKPELMFRLTLKGRAALPRVVRERVVNTWPHAAAVAQQIVANDVRLCLEQYARSKGGRLAEWRPEREIRAEYQRELLAAERAGGMLPRREIADAEAILRSPAGTERKLLIEVDGRYFGKALAAKAARIARCKEPTWWVCTSQLRAGTVEAACQRYENIIVLYTDGAGSFFYPDSEAIGEAQNAG